MLGRICRGVPCPAETYQNPRLCVALTLLFVFQGDNISSYLDEIFQDLEITQFDCGIQGDMVPRYFWR